jgi:DNA-binding NarL/FixJ family response regulator
MKVLLIDDDDIFNFVHKRVIERIEPGVEVIVINSCRSALEYLAGAISSMPDFIFLDINMPEMNGFDFLDSATDLAEEIKSKMKVVFVTSSLNEADVVKAHSYPMVVGFQDKPLNAEVIAKLLANK